MGTVSVTLPSDNTTADVSDYNTPITTIVNEINGNLDNANIKTGAAIAGSKLADASIDIGSKASAFDGWVAVSDSWAYASATTITVPTDATTKYSVGDKIKIVQSAATKYFYITAVAATVLTVNGGTDYTVANSAISGIYYSKVESPLSFPGWFNFTPTWTGFSANPTTVARFCMNNKTVTVTIRCSANGTSNATSTTITNAPATAKTVANMFWFTTGFGTDNGTGNQYSRVYISSNSAVITMEKAWGSANWTASAGKACDFTLVYEAA